MVALLPTASHSIFADDGKACARELGYDSTLLARTFCPVTNGFAIDYMTSEKDFQREVITDDSGLRRATLAPSQMNSRRTKIFSIASGFSNEPLAITRPAAQNLVQQLDVNISFVQIILAFGEKPRRSEAALNCYHMTKKDKGSFEVMYLFRFAEAKEDPEDEEWELRQIGVYHRHDYLEQTNSAEDVFIFLQPHHNSSLDEYLGDIAGNPEDRAMLTEHPVRLHSLLFQIYFNCGWRGYLHQASESFTRQSDQIFTEGVYKDEGVTYHTLREWRDLADRIMPISAIIESQYRILQNFQTEFAGGGSPSTMDPNSNVNTNMIKLPIQSYISMAEGFKSSAQVLRSRIDGVIGLLANTIDMKNQYQAHLLNRHMRSLTQDTVDDSANVKIVTVMSLVYLPASFLATLFGMDFFNFDDIRRRISVSKDFWIFFVLVVPLTFSTVGGWVVLSRRAKKRREQKITTGVTGSKGSRNNRSSSAVTSTGVTGTSDPISPSSSSSSGGGGNGVFSRASTTLSMTEMGKIPKPIRLAVRG